MPYYSMQVLHYSDIKSRFSIVCYFITAFHKILFTENLWNGNFSSDNSVTKFKFLLRCKEKETRIPRQ